MKQERRRRSSWQGGLLRLSSRATGPLDRQLHQFILELVPAEDGIPIPGVLGFIGCWLRRLVRPRAPLALPAPQPAVALSPSRRPWSRAGRSNPAARPGAYVE